MISLQGAGNFFYLVVDNLKAGFECFQSDLLFFGDVFNYGFNGHLSVPLLQIGIAAFNDFQIVIQVFAAQGEGQILHAANARQEVQDHFFQQGISGGFQTGQTEIKKSRINQILMVTHSAHIGYYKLLKNS